MAKTPGTLAAKPLTGDWPATTFPPEACAPKFKVGDKVRVGGEAGEVIEVVRHDEHWFAAGHPQMYSVRLRAWKRATIKDRNGEDVVTYYHPDGASDEKGRMRWRDHEADTLGCVPEAAINLG